MKPSILKPNVPRKRPKRLLAVITYVKEDFQTIADEREFFYTLLVHSSRSTKSIEIVHAPWGEVGKLKLNGNKLGNNANIPRNGKKSPDNLNRLFDLDSLKPKKIKW